MIPIAITIVKTILILFRSFGRASIGSGSGSCATTIQTEELSPEPELFLFEIEIGGDNSYVAGLAN